MNTKKKSALSLCALFLAVMVTLMAALTSCGAGRSNDPATIAKEYVDAIYNPNSEKMLEYWHEDVISSVFFDDESFTKDDLKELYDRFDEELHEMVYDEHGEEIAEMILGENITVTTKFISEADSSEKDFDHEKEYHKRAYDFEVEALKDVKLEVEFKGSKSSYTVEVTGWLMKIDGTWCVEKDSFFGDHHSFITSPVPVVPAN